MGIVTSIFVYFIIWWLVLFCVLPWGNHPTEDPETGHATSAPANPRLKLKFAVTSGIAALIFIGVWFIYDAGIISFRVL